LARELDLTPDLRLPNDVAECRRRADPSKGDAGDHDDRGRTGRLDARTVGRGEGAATGVIAYAWSVTAAQHLQTDTAKIG
jgi:hypothetical protein